MNALAQHAQQRIDGGAAPQDLAHIVGEGNDAYVSTPITQEEHSRGGYTARYYTLAYIANGRVQA